MPRRAFRLPSVAVTKDFWLSLLLAVIVITAGVDIAEDRALNVPVAHLVQEGILLLLSALACAYLILEMHRRSRAMRDLRYNLTLSDARLASLDEELRRSRSAFAETIRKQFHRWDLTESEQEVALLLLKGLSIREIAELRSTREKTVRQHASHVYAKAGLEGRHALAAWFLEDFMARPREDAAADRRSVSSGT